MFENSAAETDLSSGSDADGEEIWLPLTDDPARFSGRWIEVVYETAFCGPVVRPVLRFLTPKGPREELISGAPFGRAVWVGKVPAGAREISISPGLAGEPVALRVHSVKSMNAAQIFALALRKRPKHALLALHHATWGRARLAQRHLRRAIGPTPLEGFAFWRAARERAPEWAGFDALPSLKAKPAHIHVIAQGLGQQQLATLDAALAAQPWPRWSLTDGGACDIEAWLDGLPDDDFALVVLEGERLAAPALAAMGAALDGAGADVVYGDEIEAAGQPRPLFKPDWSPVLASQTDLAGRAWAARAGWLRRHREEAVRALAGEPLRLRESDRVAHMRRVLIETTRAPAAAFPPAAPALSAAPAPAASLIIPSGDRLDLLETCLRSVEATMGPETEAIIVSNSLRKEDERRRLCKTIGAGRFRLLERPGPFNFSALCNDAAHEARNPVLVFLNDDTEAREPEWLDRLARWTLKPAIGAVGAKLLYPNGRLQHAGVTLGVDGHAAHFERFAPGGAAGYFRSGLFAREVSAVTGACLAVSAEKFHAVGGFDAVNLPVEFSDIDLCLRLAERGWVSLMEPRAVLVHHEAASRKAWLMQDARYAAEVAWFQARWRRQIRDDPYFHPALSLDRHDAALS